MARDQARGESWAQKPDPSIKAAAVFCRACRPAAPCWRCATRRPPPRLLRIALREPTGAFEDLYRQKWTWDRVVRGTHGINCAGTCAFNVYVKNGIVWREEQQAEYGASGDSPDYGPRGCQKGLRHSKYMYGPQRILYPMKRVGERGDGKWERVTWEQAADEIADKFIDVVTQHGPQAISLGTGTQLSLKRASMAGLARFGALGGLTMPEMYSGVGDLPSGLWATTGENMAGDTMGAIFQSKCCLVWCSNPAATRIPDAHFFWGSEI